MHRYVVFSPSSTDATHETGNQWVVLMNGCGERLFSCQLGTHSPDSWEPEVPGNHISLRGWGQRGIKERPPSVTELGGPPRSQTKHKQTATAGPGQFRSTQGCICRTVTLSLFSHIWAEHSGHVRRSHAALICSLNKKDSIIYGKDLKIHSWEPAGFLWKQTNVCKHYYVHINEIRGNHNVKKVRVLWCLLKSLDEHLLLCYSSMNL